MSRALGIIFLLVGALMIYFGWQAHEVVSSSASPLTGSSESSHSIWLLTLGAVAAVWGLAVLLRRKI